jgi:hypothetical protein
MSNSGTSIQRLVALVGEKAFHARLAELGARTGGPGLSARALQQRHAAELIAARILARGRAATGPERTLDVLAGTLASAAATLPKAGLARLKARLADALAGANSLLPLLHLARTAHAHETRGFAVAWTGLAAETPHDLLIRRDGAEAEIACDVVSAEAGRSVHRGAWFAFVDRLNPDLQTWLAAHPGRYLLKMTLPEGLAGPDALPALHARVMGMLQNARRTEAEQDVVLKLDPLVMAAAADQTALVDGLRAQFGPQAHLAVTAAPGGAGAGGKGGSMFVMAARAGREDEVAGAIARHCAPMAARLSGQRPGILALLVEDVGRAEWRALRERLEIEGAARGFLTDAAARAVVCVQCMSRLELFSAADPDAAPDGELRFRNPAHPAARDAALAPAVTSTV